MSPGYRLHNGSLGTRVEAVRECLATLKAKRAELDKRIEEYETELASAEPPKEPR